MTSLDVIMQKLADEIDRLAHELTVTLPLAIQKAVELGDLSENSEYTSALERQQFVQARLHHLRQRAGELSKIEAKSLPADRVGFGSKVGLEDGATGEKFEYLIVFGDYIELDTNQISMASPIGRALIGREKGEEVTVQLPRGERSFKIVALTTLHDMVS